MATTKAKTAKKSGAKKTSAKSKAASSKPKTVKAVEAKTTKKAKVTTVDKVQDEAEKVAEEKVKIVSAKSHPIKEFFARKFDASENILTIFKNINPSINSPRCKSSLIKYISRTATTIANPKYIKPIIFPLI